MCGKGKKKNLNIPNNADKILFAEDFVNCALRQFVLPCLSSGIDGYRTVIYNAFTPTVRAAAMFLYRRLENEILEAFENIRRHHPLDRNSFMNYVTSIGTGYISRGFDAQRLLHFCVQTTAMAIKFYCNGFHEAPTLAVQRIINILGHYNMNFGGWARVNFIAANYARIYVDVDETADSESECESDSVSSEEYSDASDLVTTPNPADGSKYRKSPEPASDAESSDEEYSEAFCLRIMSIDDAREGDGKIRTDIQKSITYLPLDNAATDSKRLKATSSVSFDDETSSEGEAKVEGVHRESDSSIYIWDTEDEYDSDVFEDNVNVESPCDRLRRRVAKKRQASSSSSSSGFHVSDSGGKSDAYLNSFSASVHREDASSPESSSSAETLNVTTSPVRKHIAKSRKKF